MEACGLIEIIPLICTLTTEGQHPVFLQTESPQGAGAGWRWGGVPLWPPFPEMAGYILCPQYPP